MQVIENKFIPIKTEQLNHSEENIIDITTERAGESLKQNQLKIIANDNNHKKSMLSPTLRDKMLDKNLTGL